MFIVQQKCEAIYSNISILFWGGRLGVDELILKIFVLTFGCWCWTSFHDVGTKRVFSLLVVIKVTVAPNSVCLLFWRKHTVASPLLYLYLWIFVFVDICMCISSSFQRGAEGGKEKNWLSPSITTSALRTAQLPSYWATELSVKKQAGWLFSTLVICAICALHCSAGECLQTLSGYTSMYQNGLHSTQGLLETLSHR